jgi:2-phosphosulfolactate phosphatase
MRLDIVSLPSRWEGPSREVCIVVDVLRASSTAVAMMASGAQAILVAADVDEARRQARDLPDHLLCGERGGLPPPGFDYGNSPREFAALDLKGRRAILCTSNGTKAIGACAEAPLVLVGALLNAAAVGRAAVREATERKLDIVIVCAGDDGGTSVSPEDVLGAGAIADAVCSQRGTAVEPTAGAQAALDLWRAWREQEEGALRASPHGRELISLGLGEDLAFCARTDAYRVVPALASDEEGRLVLRPLP